MEYNYEYWKEIPGWEKDYNASSLGRIYSKITNRYLKPGISQGYSYVSFRRKSYKLCRVIATTFIPNPENKRTVSENVLHAFRVLGVKPSYGMKGKFGKDRKTKLIGQYDLEGNYIKTWYGMMDIQRELGYWSSGISVCCRGIQQTAYGFKRKYL